MAAVMGVALIFAACGGGSTGDAQRGTKQVDRTVNGWALGPASFTDAGVEFTVPDGRAVSRVSAGDGIRASWWPARRSRAKYTPSPASTMSPGAQYSGKVQMSVRFNGGDHICGDPFVLEQGAAPGGEFDFRACRLSTPLSTTIPPVLLEVVVPGELLVIDHDVDPVSDYAAAAAAFTPRSRNFSRRWSHHSPRTKRPRRRTAPPDAPPTADEAPTETDPAPECPLGVRTMAVARPPPTSIHPTPARSVPPTGPMPIERRKLCEP